MKIQLKRSDVLDGGKAKEPTSANMKDGELAINYNSIDPSFFIKDTSGDIRKLSLVDTENVQSDWNESNPNSPAYIKNKQVVNQELADLESLVNTKIGDAAIDNKTYGRRNADWKLVTEEAEKDGEGYVRKDGAWYAITEYGYATKEYATNEAQAAALIATATANEYTDSKVVEVNDVIFEQMPDFLINQGFLTDADSDGEVYGRKNGDWVIIDTSGGGGNTPIDTSKFVTTNTNQSIDAEKRFNRKVEMRDEFDINDGSAKISFGDNVAVQRKSMGFSLTRNGREGTESGNSSNTGQGGAAVVFLSGSENCKIGIRNRDPDTALHVNSTIRANQYQNRDGNPTRATFDGHLFVSEAGYDFVHAMRLHSDLYQEGGSYRKVAEQATYSASVVSTAEKAAATGIRSAIRGYTKNGKRCFEVDKQTLVSAFTTAGLDIANYDIVKEVEQTEHLGFVDDDIDMNITGYSAGTYTAVNYENLFAFLLAAGPDLSSIEARLAALENVS